LRKQELALALSVRILTSVRISFSPRTVTQNPVKKQTDQLYFPLLSLRDNDGFNRQYNSRIISPWIRVYQKSANGSAIPDMHIANLQGSLA
jgi:hypothetical protein